MLLDDLTRITTLGAKQPIAFWAEQYHEIARGLIPDLQAMGGKLEAGTPTKQNIDHLTGLLAQDQPDEFGLAKSLLGLSDVFVGNTPQGKQEAVGRFVSSCKSFYGRSQTAQMFASDRERIKNSLPDSQWPSHDLSLFMNEGMMYCLEYYLALYKAIADAPSDEEKRRLVESRDVNLGFGATPGLRADFLADEALAKFILKILDDDIRNMLTRAYYTCKVVIVDEKAALDDVLAGLKAFLQNLLESFRAMGIERLASLFFKPYGDKPRLDEINL